MNRKRLQDLQKVTDALYQKQFQSVQKLLAEESRLRSAVARLDQQSEPLSEPRAEISPLQATGADVMWQRWAEKTRANLNQELALVLAQKLQVMDRVRHAFGRNEAAKELVKKAASTR